VPTTTTIFQSIDQVTNLDIFVKLQALIIYIYIQPLLVNNKNKFHSIDRTTNLDILIKLQALIMHITTISSKQKLFQGIEMGPVLQSMISLITI